MLLAQEGDVCRMYRAMCCTSDGSVTLAIQGLTALSQEMAENSDVDDPFTRILESWFGRWSRLISPLLVSLAVAMALISV